MCQHPRAHACMQAVRGVVGREHRFWGRGGRRGAPRRGRATVGPVQLAVGHCRWRCCGALSPTAAAASGASCAQAAAAVASSPAWVLWVSAGLTFHCGCAFGRDRGRVGLRQTRHRRRLPARFQAVRQPRRRAPVVGLVHKALALQQAAAGGRRGRRRCGDCPGQQQRQGQRESRRCRSRGPPAAPRPPARGHAESQPYMRPVMGSQLLDGRVSPRRQVESAIVRKCLAQGASRRVTTEWMGEGGY